jgi:hypothetical protein
MASLNIIDLTKLTNDHILHDATWSNMLTKLPLDTPMFDGKPSKDRANHVMIFYLWCASKNITNNSICLQLFQRTLTGHSAKWYMEEKARSHATFTSLAKDFLAFFQLPLHHDTNLEILSNL